MYKARPYTVPQRRKVLGLGTKDLEIFPQIDFSPRAQMISPGVGGDGMDSSLQRSGETLSFLRCSRPSMNRSESSRADYGSSHKEENIPAWKLPLTSSLIHRPDYIRNYNEMGETGERRGEGGAGGGGGGDEGGLETPLPDNIPTVSQELAEDEATAQLIQILLPCIVCNRTFSPEALERHSKICTVVNDKSPRRPTRSKFDSFEQRKKDTKLADFIPPPDSSLDSADSLAGLGCRLFRDSFSRGSKARSSLGKNSQSGKATCGSLIPTRRKMTTRGARNTENSQPPMMIESYENNSEFGSDESQDAVSTVGSLSHPTQNSSKLPHYARALSPTDLCPYCGRSFSHKAYDRHFKFCEELFIRKQYETQPMPKEKEEALERQEIRTKYRQMKGSSSYGSLRASSPPKDFTSLMAIKLYGFMNRTFSRGNNNNKDKDFKKSNESLPASCFGDYTRGLSRASPAPSSALSTTTASQYGGRYGGGFQRSKSTLGSCRNSSPLRIHNSSNIPKRTKSIESVPTQLSMSKNMMNLSTVPSSGYGQHNATGHYSNNINSSLGLVDSFSRNVKTRSSLHKNFWSRNAGGGGGGHRVVSTNEKRAEPEGLESNPIIMNPLNFYSKPKNYYSSAQNSPSFFLQEEKGRGPGKEIQHQEEQQLTGREGGGCVKRGGILSQSDPDYDPYEKAARQLEELLKSQPVRQQSRESKQQSRKVGLDRAFRSVTSPLIPVHQSNVPTPHPQDTSAFFFHGHGHGHGQGQGEEMGDGEGGGEQSSPGQPLSCSDSESYWNQAVLGTNGDSSRSKIGSSPQSSELPSVARLERGTDLEFEALETLLRMGEKSVRDPPSRIPVSNSRSTSPFSLQSNNPANYDQYFERSAHRRPVSWESTLQLNIEGVATDERRIREGGTGDTGVNEGWREGEGEKEEEERGGQLYLDSSITTTAHRPSQPQEMRSSESQKNQSQGSPGSRSISGSGGQSVVGKFCHECGFRYHSTLAKFCAECGERRLGA